MFAPGHLGELTWQVPFELADAVLEETGARDLDGQGLPYRSLKALRDLWRRIGTAPFKALFEVLAGSAAQPSTPGVRFGQFRTVTFDGCASIKVPDTTRNRSWPGKLTAALGSPATRRSS